MSSIVSQITGVFIYSTIYSTVCSGTDQRKHQSSVSLAFVGEFIGDRWIPYDTHTFKSLDECIELLFQNKESS